ncbi:MAG: glycogen debranching protein, partial [Chloroflexi bacterium]|nr:glycogen debranching protein [Chloroflexota bacterium]
MIHLKELKSYAKTAKQEWLVTNGVGGYAAGTVAGALTRRYHGLLIAALNPPTERTLLVAKLDTVARFNEMTVPLYANVWGGGLVEALNLPYLIDFKLEGTTPIWTYQRAGLRLQKRIWMEQGANTTYIRYDVLDAPEPVQLSMRALVNYRNHHGETRAEGWRMKVTNLADGIRVVPYDTAVPFTIRSTGAKTTVENEWYYNFDLGVERYRGLPDNEDHLLAATFTAVVEPGSTLTMVASTDKDPDLDGEAAYARRREYEQSLLDASPFAEPPLGIEQLTLAADQFIVRRPIPSDPQGLTVIAGYPWFNDWGRDTMIALPGLTLATGRSEIAARILRTFARFVDQGMLPNQFPDEGTQPEYNTVDATLWYFQAIRAYHAAAGDDQLIKDLFPVLVDILEWHIKGTRYNIHMDEVDSLLFAGEQGTQLTWMDAK